MASNAPDTKWSFGIDNSISEPSEEMVSSLEDFRKEMEENERTIQAYRKSLGSLRGNSEEVKSLKQQITGKMNSLRESISRSNIALLKQGTSYAQLTEKAKKLAQAQDQLRTNRLNALGSAVDKIGGPVANLKNQFGGFADLLRGAGGGMGYATLAAVGLAAAIVAVTAAVVVGAVALGKWIVTNANAARSTGLVREALTGSAQDARHLTQHINNLTRQVPLADSAIHDMAASLLKGGIHGKTFVSTLEAMSQAAGALGADGAKKLEEFITRGRLAQRLQINPQELIGSGLKFDDIASEISSSMKVGMKEARLALLEGRVPLEAGAEALARATKKKFGDLNARKLLGFDEQLVTLKRNLGGLTSDVNIEPLLKGLSSLIGLLDEGSMSGAGLKVLVTTFGNEFASVLGALAPLAGGFFKGMVIAGLDLAIGFFKVKNALKSAFGDSTLLKNVDAMTWAVLAGKTAVGMLVTGVVLVGAVLAAAVAPFAAFGAAMLWLQQKTEDVTRFFMTLDWKGLGSSIVDGLIGGITSKGKALWDTVTGLGENVKKAFKTSLQIASPSKAFARYADDTVDGYVDNIEKGTPAAQRAVDEMVGPPALPSAQAAGASSGGGRAPIIVDVGGIHVQGGNGSPQEIAKAIEDSAMAKIIKALETASLGAGIPVTP